MRLKRLEISGFRGFAGKSSFELDADVVLLTGPNGSGKTSVFDAFLWALTGSIGRFSADAHEVTSHFSASGEAFVSLTLGAGEMGDLRITRTTTRSSSHDRLLVETDGTRSQGASASDLLIKRLWPAALAGDNAVAAFSTALTRSVYLQQDLVREFLTDDSEEARFKVLSELVGAGRLTELIRELEGARNRWSRAGTKETSDLQAGERRLALMKERLGRLGAAPNTGVTIEAEWSAWWVRAAGDLVAAQHTDLSPGTPEAAVALDRTLKEVESRRRALERELAAAKALLDDCQAAPPSLTPEDEAREKKLGTDDQQLTDRLAVLRGELRSAEEAAASRRRHLTELREAREELASLAELALRHLTAKCPVCDQTYDKKSTEKRLRALSAARADSEIAPSVVLNRPSAVATQIEEVERQQASIRRDLGAAGQARSRAAQWAEMLAARMRELNLQGDAHGADLAIQGIVDRHQAALERLTAVQREGERLALLAARVAEQRQRRQLEVEIQSADAEVNGLRTELAAHARTYDVATDLIRGSREAAWDAVRDRIDELGPVAERIYARIDPHPVLTDVAIETTTTGQRGKVSVRIADRLGVGLSLNPASVLSSSQLNGLAVSLFLAFSLGVRETPLECVLLDDPLQTLDDVNLLGIVDVFRRLKSQRQIILSTHDDRFASLLRRKLRPVEDGHTTVLYAFDEWTVEGPSALRTEIAPTSGEILVAA